MIKDFTKTSWKVGDMQQNVKFLLNGMWNVLSGNSEILTIEPKVVEVYSTNFGQNFRLSPANQPQMNPSRETIQKALLMIDA